MDFTKKLEEYILGKSLETMQLPTEEEIREKEKYEKLTLDQAK